MAKTIARTAKKKGAVARKPVTVKKKTSVKKAGGKKQKEAGGIGSDAVRKATGRGLDQWFTILDGARATSLTHKEIAVLLHEREGAPEWWCQMITVEYERARGMRQKHERPDGYSVSASRTMAASAAEAFRAWNDATRRGKWLEEEITIRKANADRNLRITWADGTNVEVNLWAKGERKTQVVVQHSKLVSAAAGERMKAFWAGKLTELEGSLV